MGDCDSNLVLVATLVAKLEGRLEKFLDLQKDITEPVASGVIQTLSGNLSHEGKMLSLIEILRRNKDMKIKYFNDTDTALLEFSENVIKEF